MATRLSNGKYREQKYAGRDPKTGKRIYVSFTSTKTGKAGKREVENMAANWALDRKEREASHGAITLNDAMEKYIDTCRTQGRSPSTVMAYVSVSKNAFPDMAMRKVASISAADVQHAVDARADKHSPKTVRNELGFLTAVLKTYAPGLDLSNIKIRQRKKRKKMVIRHADAQRILEEAREETEFYLYILFTMQLGLRPSESYALTWADISAEPMTMIDHGERLEYGTVSISKARVRGEFGYEEKDPKTESGNRVIPTSWNFFKLLYAIKPRGHASSHILTMQPNSVSKRWASFREKLGLPDGFRFYDLRHYHASVLIAQGATEEMLASELGHSSSAITHEIYAEIIGEKQDSLNANMIRHASAMLTSENDSFQNATQIATLGLKTLAK